MADKKISQLTSASTPLTGTEELAIVQGGSTVKATAQDIADLAGAPYLVYSAIITQSNTDAPVPTVLQNTLGGNITFTRTGTGDYRINSSNLFGNNGNKCFIILGSNREPAIVGGTVSTLITRYSSDSQIYLFSMNSALNSFVEGFGAIYQLALEIRVYP